MEPVLTKRKQGRMQNSEKPAIRTIDNAKQQAQINFFWHITKNDRKELGQSKAPKNLTWNVDAKLQAWKSHYKDFRMLSFHRIRTLKLTEAVEGPSIFATEDMVAAVTNMMKQGKTGGTSGVVVEMIKAGGREIIKVCEQNHYKENIPEDWKNSRRIDERFRGWSWNLHLLPSWH